ncbi:MAG: malonyl-CoA decarboxylase family protein [Microthrixaceae bacterium]|nr:malonyl-CoA decarboxylase family protein [Microthrixaceae bacterium]
MSSRRSRSGLQGVLSRIGVWNRSPRDPEGHSQLSSRDLGRLDRVFARLVEAPELSERRRLAAELVTLWAEDVPPARENLLRALADQSLPDADRRANLGALGSVSPDGRAADRQRLELLAEAQQALRMQADAVLDELSAAPGGVRFLIELRAAAAEVADRDPDPAAAALDLLVRSRLRVLMTPSLIQVRRLDWDTPASLLQRISVLEKVHPIESIEQLRDRLDTDRTAFALFHPGMDDEPLAFVWVAFTKGMPDSLGPITDPAAPTVDLGSADTAVFWSISSPQRGLAGLGLGNELIKAAVARLRTEQPNLDSYVTLSPVPSFAQHVLGSIDDAPPAAVAAPEGGEDTVAEAVPGEPPQGVLARLGMNRSADDVSRLLVDDVWMVSHEADELAEPMMRLAAEYLSTTDDSGRSPDPVANFHLGNGAQLARVCWGADRSPDGVARSLTLMVNYRYEPEQLSERARRYRIDGRVSLSDEVARLLDEASG